VDTRTRHSLKQDRFAKATASSMNWVSGHRSGVMRWIIVAAVVVLAVATSMIYWGWNSSKADAALGAALDTYTSPLLPPGAPALSGMYATSGERAKAANQKFVAVARQYGWLPEGAKAHYFAGVTYEELGNNTSSEAELKIAAGAWNWGDRNLTNLAKLALAGLYHKMDRDPEAIGIYNALASKPSETVPAAVAQLDLADMYAEEGKTDQAQKLWAKVKDADKDGMAGAIAAQKLGGKQ
jgi:predicted negative regulator of RcsB-dependent stress response